MTHEGLFNEIKLGEQIKKLKKQLREVQGELSIIKGINFNSDKQKEINTLNDRIKELDNSLSIALEINDKYQRENKALKDDIKEAREINKLHQELNGNLRQQLELEKKEHAITIEDVQAKDLEIGRMMKKLNN